MPKYTYEIPAGFLLLHNLTTNAGSFDYIKIVVGCKSKASATNGAVAGVISQTMASKDMLKPVKTLYIKSKEASKAFRKTKGKPLVFEFQGSNKSKLLNHEGVKVPFSWTPGDKEEPTVDVDNLFPDPDINEPRKFVRMPLYAVKNITKILDALNVQEINFLFCDQGEPAVSHYVKDCMYGGELQLSFVTAMTS